MAGMAGLRASNLQVASVALKDRDTVAGTVAICFDLSWDFSWKDGMHQNWDAAWVFVKAYDEYNARWKQVALAPPQGRPVRGGGGYMALPHSIGKANVPFWAEFATSHTDYGEKTVGFFLYRKDEGNGSNLVEDIRLQWNYVEDGFLPGENLQVSVFAIEMVYIPAHTYIIGDGASPASLYADGKNLILKQDVLGPQSQYMGKVSSETGWTYLGTPIPDTFPKGLSDFYIMKYEISQHAYADFLNTLSPEQQANRCSASPYAARGTMAMAAPGYTSNPGQYRNYIRVRTPAVQGDASMPAMAARFGHSITAGTADSLWDMETNGGNVACNFLSWDDGLAYLDWACLRPFTEMEYEKACRGPKFVRKEMAWGYQYGICINPAGAKEPFFIDPFLPSERAVDPSACYLETGRAPWVMRVGGFAGDSTRRNQSGATYYGVMNMSDNLWERCVNVSTAAGRAFLPKEGDGLLDDAGFAEVFVDLYSTESCWPAAEGGGFRGNRVSDRTYAESTQVKAGEGERTPYSGFRGARSAPPATRFDLRGF